MNNPGDRLKELTKNQEVVKAMGTLLRLPMDDLIVICAFFVRIYSPTKITPYYMC